MQQSEYSGFSVYNAETLAHPILLSVPHAGREYPSEVFGNLRLPPETLLRLEDRYADLLAKDVVVADVPVIVASRARAWIDLNRDETDIDADMVEGMDRSNLPTPGAKQRGGLGLIPRRLSGAGDIWRTRIPIGEINGRIENFHRPYHAQIEQILSRMHDKFGVAILLDLHSMPPLHLQVLGKPPQIVVGDLFGRSAHARFSESLLERIKLHGFNGALNHPYSGDYILRRHSNPAQNIHAIQLEIDRTLYLDDILREPGTGLPMIASLVTGMAQMLAEEALGNQTLMAAE